jgi:hypothetical protein
MNKNTNLKFVTVKIQSKIRALEKFSFYFKLKLLSKYCYILIKNSEGFKENCHIPMGSPKTEFPTQCWGGRAIFYQLIS